ncbi:MAG: glycoside hydrolase family 5 protein, partial [Cytophagaceae bacterium]|nr:glycoside hydrolase family 5 protein [Cytophagaceae bacterium]
NIVRGTNQWEMARISIEFYDEGGQMVGGYPPVTGQRMGTSEWKEYKMTYDIPAGATQVKITCALGNAKGTAWYDDIAMVILDATGNTLAKGELKGPMDEGEWYPVKVNKNNSGSHYVDWSGLLDAPAGKHGFMKAVNGHFQFEDGTKVKFWGTNIVASACFPSKENADSVATRLAKMGCNLVRLHHMDAPWANPNIFGGAGNATTLDPASMDKLDYLIAALKKKGIYIFMDLLVHRDFSVVEGVENKPPDLGGKQVGYFDPEIIKWQKDYAKQLLTHVNPYTKLAYNQEPAIIASEFINESSAFVHFGGDILNEPYRNELNEMFAAKYPGKKLSVFDLDYGHGALPWIMERANTKGDVKESIQFLNQIELSYYKDMYTELRNKIGVRYPLAGSNFPIPVLSYQKNNTSLDFIITNDYWDHPQLWKIGGDWAKVLYAPINNLSMIKNPANSISGNVARYKWNNYAFLVTEYNACYPNEYLLEGAPFVAAYSALQGNDGMLQFDFDPLAPGADRINSLSLAKSPDNLAQWVAAAPMFLRGDIKTAPGLVLDQVTEEEAGSLPLYSDFLDTYSHLPFVTKVAKTAKNEKADDPSKYANFYSAENKIIKSETGELMLDSKEGVMQINTAKVQGAMGNLKDKTIELPFLKIKVNNSWASVIVVSKDGKPLAESKNYYLIVVGPTKMTNQKYNDSRLGLVDIGELPVLAQVVNGDVTFTKDISKAQIIPLYVDGTKGKALKSAGQTFNLTSGRTFVYEIIIK